MYELLPQTQNDVLGVRLGGALTGDDYRALRAALQRAGRDGPVHLLVLADDHHGPAEPGAAWADPADAPVRPVAVGRLALVGDGEWHTWTAWLDRLLAPDAVRSFSEALLAEAWAWLREGDTSPASPPEAVTDPDPCPLLLGLVEALREAAPRLNGGLPYPQRTGIDDVQAGAPRPDGPARCSLPVTVRVARGVEKRYVLSVETGAGRAALAVSDGAEFEDRFRLATTPGDPPVEADVHRLFTALTADLGLHFATAS